jgi:3-dehydroquinate synthetase
MIKESPLLHGEAVAVDIAYSACLALVRNRISETQLQRIFNLMQ